MPVHALTTTVKVSGTAVAVTGEATTHGAGNLYQVTNTAKRIIDPNAAVVVKDGGVPVLAKNVLINYLFGTFTLASPPGGAVTADFSYLPMNAIGEAKGYDFTRSRSLLDTTVFHATDKHRKRLAGLKDLSGSLKSLSPFNTDIDAGVGGVQSVDVFFNAGTPKLLEIRPGATGAYFRAWILFSKEAQTAAVDALVEGNIDFSGTSLTGVGQLEGTTQGWGT